MRIGRFLSVTEINNYIREYHTPSLALEMVGESIPNNVPTPIRWEIEYYDELGLWSPDNPTLITPDEDALWLITLDIIWQVNTSGARIIEMYGQHHPPVSVAIRPYSSYVQSNHLTSLVHVSTLNSKYFVAWQNSGVTLQIQSAQLLIAKQVPVPYPF